MTSVMDRRMFVTTVGGTILAAPLAAEGQPQTGKVYRIGVIVAADAAANTEGPDPRNQSVAALLRRLRDLGYVYGRDFVTEPRSAEGRTERSAALAEELARLTAGPPTNESGLDGVRS